MKLFIVGGYVRDKFLGVKSKDVDFAVEASSYQEMRDELLQQGFKIWLENPEFFTLRAHIPKKHWASEYCKDADFVLCRKDGIYSDGRRPDSVEVGNIFDDLKRRDFSMNAIAIDEDGKTIDPHNGVRDIQLATIRFVGEPDERIKEDGLRVIRAIRFAICKEMRLSPLTKSSIATPWAAIQLNRVSKERIRDEANKMFAHDSFNSVRLLGEFPAIESIVYEAPFHLVLSMKEVA